MLLSGVAEVEMVVGKVGCADCYCFFHASRKADIAVAVVMRDGHKDYAVSDGIVDGGRERKVGAGAARGKVDDLGALAHRVIDSLGPPGLDLFPPSAALRPRMGARAVRQRRASAPRSTTNQSAGRRMQRRGPPRGLLQPR